jgi:hypothetical protein
MIQSRAAKVLRAIVRPEIAVRQIIKRFGIGSVEFRLALQALDRPQYAFGVHQAILLASRLKHPRVSVLEFGVARGGGLLALEKYAAEMGKRAGIEVEVYGFDLGSGLPAALDYRDLGYVWKRGAYEMDVDGLKKQLTSAKLILGDVRDTVARFLDTPAAPVGFISFDLDYYTSTVSAFHLFSGADARLLPRVVCYFDDIVSDSVQMHCDSVGELLAIREFNEQGGAEQQLAPLRVLECGLMFSAAWMEQIWVYHRFHHPEYNTYIGE